MTPEESSVFFSLLKGQASEPERRFVDFLADPDCAEWDDPAGKQSTYRVGDYIAYDLQEHARGCKLPIAKCHLCRLCELEIKRRWPDLWLSKWPGAKADEADETHEFTALEFEVIFGMCWGWAPYWRLGKKGIAEQLGFTEGIVHAIMSSISEKIGLNLREFVRTALNEELRRRVGGTVSPSALLAALEDIAHEASAFDLFGGDPAADDVIRKVSRRARAAIDKARGRAQ